MIEQIGQSTRRLSLTLWTQGATGSDAQRRREAPYVSLRILCSAHLETQYTLVTGNLTLLPGVDFVVAVAVFFNFF